MYLKNGRLSKRQIFRVGMLENIALGIVVIPYITTKLAGNNHVWAFFIGMLFTVIYSGIMFCYSKLMPYGLIETIDKNMGWYGPIFDGVYCVRYIIKASLIILFFGRVIKEYMLRGYNIWVIIIPFVFICMYGAARDIEKRGRLLEFLFWWMVVPLIIVAVFSISNVAWTDVTESFFHGVGFDLENRSVGDVFTAAYTVLLVLQTIELMQFNLCYQRKNEWQNALKLLIWIVVAMVLAYVFIIGILGSEWVATGSKEAFSVIQASSFPGGLVERLDYPVLAFWIIGIFAMVSGYLHYSKEFLSRVFNTEKKTSKLWPTCIVLVLVICETILISESEKIAQLMFNYVFYVDLAISLIVPLVVYFGMKYGDKKRVSKKQITSIFLIMVIMSFTVGCSNSKKYNANLNESVENRDYVTEIDLSYEERLQIIAEVADLAGYQSDTAGKIKTNRYECDAECLSDLQRCYYEENGKMLDLGHLELITMENLPPNIENEIVDEMREMPEIAKSVSVKCDDEVIILRKLIKECLSGESS